MTLPNPRLAKLPLTTLVLVGLCATSVACGDARYREPAATASGYRSPAESSGVTLPTTIAQGGQGALAGGVVDTPLGVRAESTKYRLVNTALTPGTK